MALAEGTRLGRYVVAGHIGAGGMGEVYRARDTRLDRTVAIKVLPQHLSSNAERRARFEREARAISALSHPNICALYDVGQESGVDYLVMEFLEGESLAARLARGPLPIDDALRYGAEIAAALGRAHHAGILHRDLKPGNVMLTKSGAKLVDFGLAKARVGEEAPSNSETLRMSTVDPATAEGTILGTVPYMSPEQLEGQPADARSDIFSLGAVLYEMLTGRRAFPGSNTASTIAAIMNANPPAPRTLRSDVPPAVEQLVRTALAKDPDERWQDAHDIALLLRQARSADAAESSPKKRTSLRVAYAGWLLALVLAIVAGAALLRGGKGGQAEEVTFSSIAPPPGHETDGVSLSPDGKTLLLSTRRNGDSLIWTRGLRELKWRQLPNFRFVAPLAWSPDSRAVAYGDGTSLYVRRLDSDNSDRVADITNVASLTWDGDRALLVGTYGGPIVRLELGSGKTAPVTDPPSRYNESFAVNPQILPSGRLAYLARKTAGVGSAIYVTAPQPGSPRKKIVDADALVAFVPPHHLFYARNSALYVAELDVEKEEVRGVPVRLIDRVGYEPAGGFAWVWVSRQGHLLYGERLQQRWQYGVVEANGTQVRPVGQPLPSTGASVSPDGTRLVAEVRDERTAGTNLVVVDLARGIGTTVVGDNSPKARAIWDASSRSIYYTADRFGFFDIFSHDLDATTPDAVVARSDFDKFIVASPRPGLLAWRRAGPNAQTTTIVNVQTGAASELPLRGSISDAAVTPDGRTIAFALQSDGGPELHVATYPDGRGRVQISSGGAAAPQFDGSGRTLYYVAIADQTVRAVDVVRNGDRFDVRNERTVLKLDGRRLVGVLPDGKLVVQTAEASVVNLPTLIDNWPALLKSESRTPAQ